MAKPSIALAELVEKGGKADFVCKLLAQIVVRLHGLSDRTAHGRRVS